MTHILICLASRLISYSSFSNAALSPELRWSQVRMGKKTKKPGKGKEKTERKTAKAEEKKSRRASKKLSPEDDIDAILVLEHKPELSFSNTGEILLEPDFAYSLDSGKLLI